MKRSLLLMLGTFFVASTALAGVTGSIAGTVTDAAGRVLPGASVVALNVETHVSISTTTNADGSYSFPNLPVGHYDLQIQEKGFSSFQETGVSVDVNSALRVDATLPVSGVSPGMCCEGFSCSQGTTAVHNMSTFCHMSGCMRSGRFVMALDCAGGMPPLPGVAFDMASSWPRPCTPGSQGGTCVVGPAIRCVRRSLPCIRAMEGSSGDPRSSCKS